MLLSFERPARHRRLARTFLGLRVTVCLFTDLENCTVANDTGINGRGLTASAGEISDFSDRIRRQATAAITVKIVRAHGGCLGTKSR